MVQGRGAAYVSALAPLTNAFWPAPNHATFSISGNGCLLRWDKRDLGGELLCDQLRRGRAELAAATLRRVRTREQPRDLVLLGEALEDVGAERRRRRDTDAHYRRTARGRNVASASLRCSSSVRSMIITPSRWSSSCCTIREA